MAAFSYAVHDGNVNHCARLGAAPSPDLISTTFRPAISQLAIPGRETSPAPRLVAGAVDTLDPDGTQEILLALETAEILPGVETTAFLPLRDLLHEEAAWHRLAFVPCGLVQLRQRTLVLLPESLASRLGDEAWSDILDGVSALGLVLHEGPLNGQAISLAVQGTRAPARPEPVPPLPA